MHQDIDKLIGVAIKNGLTDKEREILINKAVSLGLDKFEFELYLESKIEIKNINNLYACPKCGSQIPAVSKVCSFCGFVFRDDGQKTLIDNLIIRISQNLNDLRALPKFNVFRTLFIDNLFLTISILSIYGFVLYLISKMYIFGFPFIFWLFSLVFVLPIRWYIKKERKKANKIILPKPTFKSIKINYEENKKIASIYYGESFEIKKIMDNFSIEIEVIELARKKNIKNTFTISAILALLLLSVFLIPFKSINAKKEKKFNTEMQHLIDFKTELNSYDSIVEGEISEYAYVSKQVITLKYDIGKDIYNNSELIFFVEGVTFNIIQKDELLSNSEYSTTLNLELIITDQNGKPIKDLPVLKATDTAKFISAIKSGKGEVIVDFKSEKRGGISQKGEFEDYTKNIENSGKYFIVKSSYYHTTISKEKD
jgi:hypothetical protein